MAPKNVLVTGATRGLGLAIARRLVSDGFQVIGTGRQRSEGLDRLIAETDGAVSFVSLDLEDRSALHPLVNDVLQRYGAIYGLVNNAALAHDGVLATMHESQIVDLVNVNVTGTILLTKYAVRAMLLGSEGRIVNVASIVADTGFNGLSVYGATKAALVGFTRSLARELGRAGITVNAVAPGFIQTDMSSGLSQTQEASIVRRTPLGRLTTVEEAAGSVAFLLGPDATATTGMVLTVDGGATA